MPNVTASKRGNRAEQDGHSVLVIDVPDAAGAAH
jgi:hypothetical protein